MLFRSLKVEKLDDEQIKARAKLIAKRMIDKNNKVLSEKIASFFSEGQRVFRTHDPFARFPINWENNTKGVYNYLKSTGSSWRLCVLATNKGGGSFPFDNWKKCVEFSCDVSGEAFGFEREQFSNYLGFWGYAGHFQITVKYCRCNKCYSHRELIRATIKKLGASERKTDQAILLELTAHPNREAAIEFAEEEKIPF